MWLSSRARANICARRRLASLRTHLPAVREISRIFRDYVHARGREKNIFDRVERATEGAIVEFRRETDGREAQGQIVPLPTVFAR